MANLKTNFMGLELKNPIIAGSSSITNDAKNIAEIEKSGAAAIILRSLFEEELQQQSSQYASNYHPEAYAYDFSDADMLYGDRQYLDLIENSKAKASIPIIASVNCIGDKWWINYTKDIQDAGADGIEINLAYLSFDINDDVTEIENKYVDTVKLIKDTIAIPVSIKIGQNFTSIPVICKKIKDAGADAITIFNRYYNLGIDIESLEFKSVHHYSSKVEMYKVLRWVAVLSSKLDIDISSTTGVHNADMAIQLLLAGSTTVQLASKLYRNGISSIFDIVKGIEEYMDSKNIKDMKSLNNLLKEKKEDFSAFERIQYLKVAGGNF